MSFAEFLTEDRRLVYLRFLAGQPAFRMNDSVAQEALERLGHSVTRDVVRGDFAWLDEQGLVKVEIIGEKIHVATLTERGADVANGRTKHPGVKRPAPGA